MLSQFRDLALGLVCHTSILDKAAPVATATHESTRPTVALPEEPDSAATTMSDNGSRSVGAVYSCCTLVVRAVRRCWTTRTQRRGCLQLLHRRRLDTQGRLDARQTLGRSGAH